VVQEGLIRTAPKPSWPSRSGQRPPRAPCHVSTAGAGPL